VDPQKIFDKVMRFSARIRRFGAKYLLRTHLAKFNIKRHKYHGEWNYEIHPAHLITEFGKLFWRDSLRFRPRGP
jgi:hypothetical protein